ncbi:DUF4296 domain-containing protein [Rhodocaloribacter litoris]|uniref:DUF4296 domain-containing protein n=1 Tax=Rhodocaloribacter litoris TaxID=2558931 RepID=UPI00141FDBCB|nr:DUF4296 domain-containing protein [Rhodocaloribacter litoris]QXD15769.1 DUF4296 domain-containing protein [Rhodocaloribacter litoris]GIV60270.1 MAG: hypothetical protein KatS3mg043_1359 [Rhodothermaceae bacterium]
MRRLLRRVPACGLVLAMSLCTACSSLSPDAPPVADSTLVEVFIDLHLAAARADLYRDLPPGTRDSVLARHGLTPEEFEAAIRYYVEHPDAYVELYTRVLNRLNEERQGF